MIETRTRLKGNGAQSTRGVFQGEYKKGEQVEMEAIR